MPGDVFRLLITGSRDYGDRPAMIRALSDASAIPKPGTPFALRHGGAKGADTLADSVWRSWMGAWADCTYLEPEVYMAAWDLHGKAAGGLRNTRMLEDLKPGERIDLCIAFPLRTSRGTWDMIRKVEAAGIPWVNAVATDTDHRRLNTWRELVANETRDSRECPRLAS
jgi:hypothetical protein